MSSRLNLYQGPAASFDEPFEMLLACHERVERMLTLLEKIADRVKASGVDQDCRDAAADVTRYFDLAGPAHHLDEETHVLPLLRTGSAKAQALAGQIEQEHGLMTGQWQALREDLIHLWQAPTNGDAPFEMTDERLLRWQAFAALYRSHILTEESQVFEVVKGQLAPQALQEMGLEMARRRQDRPE
ncbi:MAG: hemerythrin domain-containing protein [Burkholderiaceae bacterium]